MGLSLIELHNTLEAKGGATGNYTSLQNLKTLLNSLGSIRTTTYPADTGQDIVGAVTCTAHDPTKFPYASGLSLGQVRDWSTSYLKQMTCDNYTRVVAYCSARTAVVCECNGRTNCSCNINAYCICNARTLCYQNCTANCDCVSRTDISCSCNSRTACYCNTRCGCNTEDSYA